MRSTAVRISHWLILTMLLLLAGCDDAEIQSNGQGDTATVRLQAPSSRTVTSLRVTGHNSLGDVVFGPRQQAWSPEIEIAELPASLHSLHLELVSDGAVSSAAYLPVALQPGQILTLSDLPFQAPDELIDSLTLEPFDLVLAGNTGGQLKAVGLLKNGVALDLSHSVSWSSSAPNLAFAGGGAVNAGAPGSATVEAKLGSLRTNAEVRVSEATLLSTQTEETEEGVLRVAALYSDGTQQELPASTASSPEVRAQTTVSLTSIRVTPTSVSFPKGVAVKYAATGIYSNGTSKDISSSATWSSANTTIASASAGGYVLGLRAGSTTVRAAYQGRTGSASVVVNTATLSSLTVSPTSLSLPAGTTGQLRATARFSNSVSYDVTQAATYRSSATTVASVTSSGSTRGQVKGLRAGQAAITTTFGGRSVNATANVTAATLSRIALDPAALSLPRGLTQGLTVTGIYSDGTSKNLTSTASFTSSATTVATVSTLTPRGIVTARARGSATITANVLGKTATSRVTVVDAALSSIRLEPASAVLPAGSTQRFLVRGLYSDGSQRDLTNVAVLRVQNSSLAGLTSTPGQVMALQPGTTSVTASYLGKTASAALTVTAAVLTRLDVSPSSASFPKGTSQQFTATGVYSNGTTQNLTTTASWIAADPTVVSFQNEGLTRGEKVGFTQITASFSGLSGNAQATVTPAVLTGLTLDPPDLSFPKGLSGRLTATAFFSDGTSRDVTAETSFLSSDPAVATVSNVEPRGTVTAHAEGNASVAASFSGRSAGSSVSVSPAVVTGLRVEPGRLAVVAGLTSNFQIVASYSDGSQSDVTSSAAVVIDDPTVAGLSASGTVAGLTAGSTTLSVSFSGKSASAELSVRPAVLTRLEVSPANTSFPKGTEQQFSVRGVFSDQTTQDLTSAASWSAADPSVVEIKAAGTAYGAAVGQTRVEATVGEVTGSAQAEVTAAVITTLALSPAETSIPKGLSQPLVATAAFSDGTSRDVTSETVFQSEGANIATVSMNEPRGVVSAAAVGEATITAHYSGQSATSTVSVTSAVLTSLSLQPGSASLIEGTSQTFTVIAKFSDAGQTDVTSEATLSVEDPAVASPGLTAGAIEADLPGVTRVVASFGGLTATSGLTVRAATLTHLHIFPENVSVPSGLSLGLTASGTYDNGQTQDLTTVVSWAVANPALASVGSDGTLSALAQGETEIVASLAGVQAGRAITVAPAILQTLVLEPTSLSLPVGLEEGLSVDGIFSDGSRLTLTGGLSWTVDDPAIASIATDGTVKGLGTGQTVVRVSVNEMSASAAVTVTPAVLRGIRIISPAESFPKGLTVSLQAVGTYSDGSDVEVTEAATWSSSNESVATVGDSGQFSALTEGQTDVSCELDGYENTVSLRITPAVLASIEIEPASLTLPKGYAANLAATGRFTDNTTHPLEDVVWSSADEVVAKISPAGRVSGETPGNVAIRATKGGITGTLPLVVSSATLQQLTLSAASSVTNMHGTVAWPNGLSEQMNVSGRFSDGTVMALNDQVFWSTQHPAIATTTRTGEVTARTVGTTRVKVRSSCGNVSDEVPLVVKDARLVDLRFVPPTGPLPVGVCVKVVTEGTYSDGTTKDLSYHVSYQKTSNGHLATFGLGDERVMMTAVAPGTITIKASEYDTDRWWHVTQEFEIAEVPLQQVVVTPSAIDGIPTSLVEQFTVQGVYEDGQTFDLMPSVSLSYSGSHTGVSPPSISASGYQKGRFRSGTAVGSGAVRVAQPGADPVLVPVTVVSGVTILPSVIEIFPDNPVIADGTYVHLKARVTYTNGYVNVTGDSGGWSSSNNAVASASSDGSTRAYSQGSATMTFNHHRGVSDTTTVQVVDGALKSLRISPAQLTLPIGLEQKLACLGTFTDDSERDVTASVVWSSSDPEVARIDEQGRLTTLKAGVVTVVATDQNTGAHAKLGVDVVKKTLQSLTFDEGPTYLRVDTDRAFKVEGLYTDNTRHDLTQTVDWSSSYPTVAVVGSAAANRGKLYPQAIGRTTLHVTEPLSGLTASTEVELAATVKKAEVQVSNLARRLKRSPDGSRLYLLTAKDLKTYRSSDLALLDSQTFVNASDVAVSPDGATVLVSHWDREVLTTIDQTTFAVGEIPLPTGGRALAVTFAPSGLYAYGLLEYQAVAINLQSLATTLSPGYGLRNGRHVAFDAATSTLVGGTEGVSPPSIFRWAVDGGTMSAPTYRQSPANGESLKLHPGGGRFMYGQEFDIAKLERKLWPVAPPTGGMDSVYSPTGSVVYVHNGSPYDKRIYLYCPDTGRDLGHVLPELTITQSSLGRLELSPDGSELYQYTYRSTDAAAARLTVYRLRPEGL
jgi:hypothetical protein